MKQEGESWHEWRLRGIGSSQVPAVMGISPYEKAYDVYKEKIGEGKEKVENYAMKRGKRTEPLARALFEIDKEFREFPAALAEMEKFPFMRASLDGWDQVRNEIVEFKYVGARDTGEVRAHHLCQVQYQLMVTGAKLCYYQPYDIYLEGCVERVKLHTSIEVIPDLEYQTAIMEKCVKFWRCVVDRVWQP